jgi:hypothetical protein
MQTILKAFHGILKYRYFSKIWYLILQTCESKILSKSGKIADPNQSSKREQIVFGHQHNKISRSNERDSYAICTQILLAQFTFTEYTDATANPQTLDYLYSKYYYLGIKQKFGF